MDKIKYSKQAVKTNKGWFVGYDQFGKAKFIDDINLAELLIPNIAQRTINKLMCPDEGCSYAKAYDVYVDKDMAAVRWDDLEVVYIKSDNGIKDRKRFISKQIDSSKVIKGLLKKAPLLKEWINNKDISISADMLDELRGLKHTADNIQLGNNLYILERFEELVNEAYKYSTNLSLASAYLNNKISLNTYGEDTVININFEDNNQTSKVFIDTFSYTDELDIPRISFLPTGINIDIPNNWKSQYNKERMRTSSEF